MNRFRTIAVTTLAALSLTLGGLATAGPGGQMGQGMYGAGKQACQRGAMGGPEQVTERLDSVKDALQITPEQEAAWGEYEAAVKAQAEAHAAMRGTGRQAGLSAPERMELRVTHMEQRVTGMKQVSAAMQQLYATLTPEQKQTADNLLSRKRGPARS